MRAGVVGGAECWRIQCVYFSEVECVFFSMGLVVDFRWGSVWNKVVLVWVESGSSLPV